MPSPLMYFISHQKKIDPLFRREANFHLFPIRERETSFLISVSPGTESQEQFCQGQPANRAQCLSASGRSFSPWEGREQGSLPFPQQVILSMGGPQARLFIRCTIGHFHHGKAASKPLYSFYTMSFSPWESRKQISLLF